MPEYKKKRVNRLRGAPKPKKTARVQREETDDIIMSPSGGKRANKPPKPQKAPKSVPDMRVVKGKKLERRRKAKVMLSLVSAVAVVCLVLHLILPVGILENIQNLTALIGSGGYPAELNSTEVLNSASRGMYYYVLTDTRINAYSNSGKEVFSYSHGFENPVMKTSKTRALLFSQGGNQAYIYNLASLKSTVSTENPIITANISDSGTYAVVTQSDSYASVVSVYNKYDKLVYEWYSSEDSVNNVAVSPNGKKIAVSLFNASSGVYSSKVCVFGFDSATPEYSEDFGDAPVYGLDTAQSAGFSVVTENAVSFITWSDYKKTDYENAYTAAMFRSGSGGSVALFNRASDRTDNRVAVFNSKGKLKSEFEFKGIIGDIEISGGHIYCISDTSVLLLSEDGTVLRKAECGFGAGRLAVIGSNLVAVITDNQIYKIKLEQE
ncbi:MAG: DUF5711 family protein [Acutalibacteraceae bacterium]